MIALLGSGEFMPWTESHDRELILRSSNPSGPILIFPTASAPEGEEIFDRWGQLGIRHFDKMGFEAKIMQVKTPKDANNPEIISRLAEASLLYFSGGNPDYLARTLEGTLLWQGIVEAIASGVSYAGSSAGINYLGSIAFDSNQAQFTAKTFRPGLDYFKNTVLCPHWDTFDLFVPGSKGLITRELGSKYRLIAIDEDTALVGSANIWRVYGRGSVEIYEDGNISRYLTDEMVSL